MPALPLLLVGLLAASSVPAPACAQETGESAQARPPADATPEERRAFWQKRAAERAASGEQVPAGPPADATPEARRAYWQQRAAARAGAAAAAPAGGHDAHAAHGRAITGPGVADPGRAAPAAPRWGGASGGREVVLWLTDAQGARGGRPGAWRGGGQTATSAQSGAHTGHAGAMSGADAGKETTPSRRVWLKAGANPLSARPATGEESALVQGPDGKTSEIGVEPHGGPYNVKFQTPAQGYYNVYFVRRALDAEVLNVTAAKAEVTPARMSHGMDREEAARLAVPRTEARVPVEIIRERKEDEGLMGRINYGDAITFQVLRQGRPVQNARVTFASGQGWSNSVQSDEDGRATFTVIRDYYPSDWSLFDKRHRETYLVSAGFTTPEAGEYQGGRYASTRYSASLSGAYYPGVNDYESYSDGLLVGTAGLLFTGSSVWWFRRRRVKPYKEVQFDD